MKPSLLVLDRNRSTHTRLATDLTLPDLQDGMVFSFEQYLSTGKDQAHYTKRFRGTELDLEIGSKGVAVLRIVSPNAGDMERAKRAAYRFLGVKELPVYPVELDQLKSFWDRVVWLFAGRLPA